jgi:hypothetical protein
MAGRLWMRRPRCAFPPPYTRSPHLIRPGSILSLPESSTVGSSDYLIECLLRNPEGDDFLHSGFEAGYEIAAWLKHLVKTPDGKAVLTEVAGRLALAYKAADPTTRNRIETGALEHALESRAVRPFFDSWGSDPILRDAHEHALGWAWRTRSTPADKCLEPTAGQCNHQPAAKAETWTVEMPPSSRGGRYVWSVERSKWARRW